MKRKTKYKLLFLCTGNQARSQMAEALLKARDGELFDVVSAGSVPKPAVHPLAVDVLSERGIDISAAEPKDVARFSRVAFDYVITLCDNARDLCPIFPGEGEKIHWSILDPAAAAGTDEEKLEAFRAARDDLVRRIDGFVEEIRKR
ncbi:MAG TPA: arsenate reductase ArsC [Candidatus Eisenbacteria bacterium]|uniref:Arsenate reductase ArsC n=1 Tax=Eiseniibacteriota bacterium TaxID=2212470 RepID=A0A7V2AVZ0_UNCEI|nr:arsenate reductase ArsC [Candidatus Eisenbacteria bacterium]